MSNIHSTDAHQIHIVNWPSGIHVHQVRRVRETTVVDPVTNPWTIYYRLRTRTVMKTNGNRFHFFCHRTTGRKSNKSGVRVVRILKWLISNEMIILTQKGWVNNVMGLSKKKLKINPSTVINVKNV